MNNYSVEVIVDRNDWGVTTDFKTYAQAKKYAIKESIKKGVIETFLTSDEDVNVDECQEYYKNGKLSIKIV